MIVTEKKEYSEVRKFINAGDKIFIIGCAQCATSCGTGGEKEVAELAEHLKNEALEITGTIVLDPPCDERICKIELKKHNNALNNSDKIIVLACGAGISVINDLLPNKQIVSGLDGVFLGSLKRLGVYNEYCSLCGECLLSKTGGICPVTRCAKGLLNGPCGGIVDGKYCEVNTNNRCAWSLIYERLTHQNKTKNLLEYQQPRKYNKYAKPNTFNKR
ncbi:MAG TPA: methylenetetrahydrofolate reductase C-terminal domain-containing protein [bacterium]|nr:methylenetetrahydrofolate reductase C-terminal domain-containing protein [bacterium]